MAKEIRFWRALPTGAVEKAHQVRDTQPKPTKRKPGRPRKRRAAEALTNPPPKTDKPARLENPRLDRKVEPGDRFGALTVRPERNRIDGHIYFHARCSCTRDVWLDSPGLWLRQRWHAGCLMEGCHATPVRLRYWIDPLAAIRLQWNQLVEVHREEFPNEWGGRMCESWPVARDGRDQFKAWVMALPDAPRGAWWVHRLDDEGPWVDFNMTNGWKPNARLFAKRRAPINYYGAILSATEWAQLLDLPPDIGLKLRESATGEDLIEYMQQLTQTR